MSFSFLFSILGSVIKVFRDHVKIIALFWRDTPLPPPPPPSHLYCFPSVSPPPSSNFYCFSLPPPPSTAITFLLFSPSTTSTAITLLLFSPPPLASHFYCFLPPPPPPSSHFYPWDKDVNGVNVFVRRETRFFPKKGGNWCTLYYFTRIPLKLRPWRFFTSSSIRL